MDSPTWINRAVLLFSLFLLHHYSEGGPPVNVQVDGITSTTADVTWDLPEPSPEEKLDVRGYIIYHERVDSKSRTATTLEKEYTKFRLDHLQSNQDYLVFMTALLAEEGQEDKLPIESNHSNSVQFKTYVGGVKRSGRKLSFEEWFFITVMLIVWLVVLALFFRQWGAIRDMHTGEPYTQPKNLSSIKVIKNDKESVIYHQKPSRKGVKNGSNSMLLYKQPTLLAAP